MACNTHPDASLWPTGAVQIVVSLAAKKTGQSSARQGLWGLPAPMKLVGCPPAASPSSPPKAAIMRRVHLHQFMSNLHLTTALLGLGLAVAILWLLRRDHLHVVHGLFWLLVAAAAALLGLWPRLIDSLAGMVGIAYPPALFFLLAVIVLIIKALHADITNTRVEREVRRLNQRLSLLELERQQSKD